MKRIPLRTVIGNALSKTSKRQIRQLAAKQRLTVELDLGDRNSRYCILDEAGEGVSEGQLPTTKGRGLSLHSGP